MGKTVETVTDFILGGSKITADGDCSHEIKRHLLLGRKTVTNLDSILKSRDITLPTKVHLVKAMVFPVVMCGCELDCKASWALKNWCFWTVLLGKTLESPLDCKEVQPVHPKGNQSWTSLELPHWKRRWWWGRLKAGREGDDRGWDGFMASPTWWTRVWASTWSWWLTGKCDVLQFMGSQKIIHDWATELNWKVLKSYRVCYHCGIMLETDIKRYLKITCIFSSAVWHLPRQIFG